MDFLSSPKLTSSLFLPTQSLIKKAQRFLCICLHGCQHSRLIVEQATMHWEIVEPEAGVVDSESICSGNVLVQSIHPCPLGIFIHKKAVYLTERERKSWSQLRPGCYKQTCFRSSTMGPVAQWYEHPTNNQKVLGSIPSWIPVDFAFSLKLTFIRHDWKTVVCW